MNFDENIGMKTNLGNADRVIRILVAIIIATLYFTNIISGTLALILLVVAGVLFLTAIMAFCPLYFILHLNSNKKEIQ